ncbi:MAG: hypothetical protein Q4P31_07070 [Andreesenia angusta]|nr:hypothetical protein [Andreesenia angusta]
MSIKSDWEDIIYRGRITASYKFALAETLLEVANDNKKSISLKDMGKIYTNKLIRHLRVYPKQITAKSSKFLEACMDYDNGKISEDELSEITLNMGFKNVLSRFHNLGEFKVKTRYYKVFKGSLYLTEEMIELVQNEGYNNLMTMVESRWNEVEESWNG